jgi:hypothetical protein
MRNSKTLFTVLFLTVMLFSSVVKAQVTIGSLVKPNPNALLDLKENPADSTSTKGLILPRVKLQSTDDPFPLQAHVKGMFVYNTEPNGSGATAVTEGIYYNNGAKWIVVTNGSTTGFWNLSGNKGTDPSVHFLGITDAQPLVIKVDTMFAGYISNLPSDSNYNAIGLNALVKNTGKGNNAFGLNALGERVQLGYSAGRAILGNIGNYNSAFGNNTMRHNTTGNYNSAFGANALYSNTLVVSLPTSMPDTTGSYNSAVGYNALFRNVSGSYNSAFGANALRNNFYGINNTAVGYKALFSDSIGNYNSAVGSYALQSNTIGEYNSAVGYGALQSCNGYFNSAFGSNAMGSSIGGIFNSAFGSNAMGSSTNGYNESAFGSNALQNTVGMYNSAFGADALRQNTTGGENSAFGTGSMLNNTTGDENSAFGLAALQNNITGSYNSAFGMFTMHFCTTGSGNAAFGFRTLDSNDGDYNSAFGFETLLNNSGYNNTAVGYQALSGNITITGSYNVALSDSAGIELQTGSYNVMIGHNVQPSANDVNNEVTIGTNNTTASTYRMWATGWTNASDRRLKHDIKPIGEGLSFVKKLRPVEYVYNTGKGGKELGFIAQDVQQVMREENMSPAGYNLVPVMQGDTLGLNYTQLIPVLTKAIQEQQAVIEALQKRVEALEALEQKK